MLREMRILIIPFFMLLLVPEMNAQSEATEPVAYTVDKAHSSVGFSVRHLGISRVRGSFSDYDVSVSFVEGDLSTLNVNADIRVASVDTGVDRRDNDLRSENFFNVESYPTMTFESIRVENIDGNMMDLVGNLTILDATREVTLEVEYFGTAGDKAGFSAETSILRKDFGLTWDRITEAGNIVVSNEVRIALEMELKRL
ncbi:MAG: YceI family protein [Rhodothermales bacterium]|nr:YceI family protein [Rhodothermales bacterium]